MRGFLFPYLRCSRPTDHRVFQRLCILCKSAKELQGWGWGHAGRTLGNFPWLRLSLPELCNAGWMNQSDGLHGSCQFGGAKSQLGPRGQVFRKADRLCAKLPLRSCDPRPKNEERQHPCVATYWIWIKECRKGQWQFRFRFPSQWTVWLTTYKGPTMHLRQSKGHRTCVEKHQQRC